MSFLKLFAVLVIAIAFSASGTQAAGRKVALLIGNSQYPNLGSEQQLVTPGNDVRAVGQKFSEIGFEVTVQENLGRQAFLDAILDFANKLGRDDIAVFYYAGHGVNFGGGNLMLPSDLPAPRGAGKGEEARIAANTITESQIKEVIGNARPRVLLAIFDACRDNPLKIPGIVRALGKNDGIVTTNTQLPDGVAVLYSAGEQQQALDRLEGEEYSPQLNSVFARVLLQQVGVPGQSLTQLGRNIQREVRKMAESQSGHVQRPAFYDELDEDLFLVPGNAVPARADSSSNPADEWEIASATRDISVIEAFLLKHGADPLYRSLAERELQKLRNPVLESLKLPEPSSDASKQARTKIQQALKMARPTPVAPAQTAPSLQTTNDPTNRAQGWFAVVGSGNSRDEAQRQVRELQSSKGPYAALSKVAYFVAPSAALPGTYDIKFGGSEKSHIEIICLQFVLSAQKCEIGFDKALEDADALCAANAGGTRTRPTIYLGLEPMSKVLANSVRTSKEPDDQKADLMIAELANKNIDMLEAVCGGEVAPGAVPWLQKKLNEIGYLNWQTAPGEIDAQTRRSIARLYVYGL